MGGGVSKAVRNVCRRVKRVLRPITKAFQAVVKVVAKVLDPILPFISRPLVQLLLTRVLSLVISAILPGLGAFAHALVVEMVTTGTVDIRALAVRTFMPRIKAALGADSLFRDLPPDVASIMNRTVDGAVLGLARGEPVRIGDYILDALQAHAAELAADVVEELAVDLKLRVKEALTDDGSLVPPRVRAQEAADQFVRGAKAALDTEAQRLTVTVAKTSGSEVTAGAAAESGETLSAALEWSKGARARPPRGPHTNPMPTAMASPGAGGPSWRAPLAPPVASNTSITSAPPASAPSPVRSPPVPAPSVDVGTEHTVDASGQHAGAMSVKQRTALVNTKIGDYRVKLEVDYGGELVRTKAEFPFLELGDGCECNAALGVTNDTTGNGMRRLAAGVAWSPTTAPLGAGQVELQVQRGAGEPAPVASGVSGVVPVRAYGAYVPVHVKATDDGRVVTLGASVKLHEALPAVAVQRAVARVSRSNPQPQVPAPVAAVNDNVVTAPAPSYIPRPAA